MTTGIMSAKRKYVLIFCASSLGLVVLYHLYGAAQTRAFTDDSLSGAALDLQHAKPPQAEDDIDQAPGIVIPTAESASPALKLPSEYTTLSEDQQKCDLFFTPSYLEHIATHQQQYCEEGSPSAFQCFTAPRLVVPFTAGWGETDPLCVAQGVSFWPDVAGENQQDSGAKEFNIQCKLRDLASERASSAAAAQELEGFRDHPTDWGWYWGDTGVGASLKAWDFKDHGPLTGCTRENSSSEWIMLMRRDSTDTHNLWHKLMEILQARHSLDALLIAINPATGAPWLSENDAASVQLVFDDDREELLEPLWEIVTGKKPIHKSALQASCFGNIILPLPGCGSPFWSGLLDPGYHESCPSQTLLTTYTNRIFDFYGIKPRSVKAIHKHPTITIVDRTTNRKFISLPLWTEILRERYPHSTIQTVDFAGITIEEQLRLAQSTDILVGHHGAAMSHVIFMAPGATAVEILPAYFEQHGFRAIAAMRGVQYIAGRGMHKEEYEQVVEGKPLPQNWPPSTPQDFNHWQTQEWIYITENDFLDLIDAAVKTQMNRQVSGDM